LSAAAASPDSVESFYPYRIKPGDTLISISQRYLAYPRKWPQVKAFNKVENDRRLKPGSILKIPVSLLREHSEPARVVKLSGNVEASLGPLSEGMSAAQGSEFKTGDDSALTLELADGTTLTLQPSSRLKLESLKRYSRTEMRSSVLELFTGRVESAIKKLKGPGSRFEIKTETATTGVRGTRFRLAADELGTGSEAVEGGIGIAGRIQPQKRIAVPEGFGTRVGLAGTTSPPVPLLPMPELRDLPRLQERLILRFRLPPLEGARAYRGQIAQDPRFQTLLKDEVFPEPELKFTELADGDYVLRVRGIGKLDLEGFDADFAFRLKARPEPPFLSAPPNRGKLRAERVSFQWAAAAEAAAYRFQLSDEAGFARLVFELPNFKGTEFTPAETMSPGQYYWRIASVRVGGDQGPFGDPQLFNLLPPPATPDPPKLDDRNLAFTWSGEPGQTFLFQLARDREFTRMIAEQQLSEPTVVLPRPDPGSYHMRVRATDPDGFVGPFTATQTVEVPKKPFPWWIIPIILAPLAL
jgi:hypothetical protein